MIPKAQNPVPSLHILIVEDVEEMRGLLEHVVSGIEGVAGVRTAANGFEARLELTRRRPALLLLDEILPGESSLDLFAECLADGIPVLFITGMEDPPHPVATGSKGRIFKPTWRSVDADRLRFQKAIVSALIGA